LPTHGTITGGSINPNGGFNYQPGAGYAGLDFFSYEICDVPAISSTPACDTGYVWINVYLNHNLSNNAPNPQDDANITVIDRSVSGNASLNDSDPDNQNLTYNTTLVSSPAHGTATISANGTYTYTPNNGYTGPDFFIYQVCDNPSSGTPLCDFATVYINVLNCTLSAGTCTPAQDLCQLQAGQIRIQAQGGRPPYQVSWTPAHGTPASPAIIPVSGGDILINGMQGGTTYQFTVTDANGCSVH
jgi:hypothetical protein